MPSGRCALFTQYGNSPLFDPGACRVFCPSRVSIVPFLPEGLLNPEIGFQREARSCSYSSPLAAWKRSLNPYHHRSIVTLFALHLFFLDVVLLVRLAHRREYAGNGSLTGEGLGKAALNTITDSPATPLLIQINKYPLQFGHHSTPFPSPFFKLPLL